MVHEMSRACDTADWDPVGLDGTRRPPSWSTSVRPVEGLIEAFSGSGQPVSETVAECACLHP